MRTITIPIDLDTALALLEPNETLIELVATGPGVGITIGAVRLVEEAAKIADPPPAETDTGSEEGAVRQARTIAGIERWPHLQHLRPRVQDRAGQGRPPDPSPRPLHARPGRRCPLAPTHTDRRSISTHGGASRAARCHQAVLDV